MGSTAVRARRRDGIAYDDIPSSLADRTVEPCIEILDRATRRVRIQPGARWSDVAAALAPHGWGPSSGDYAGVGVGGLATAAGVGWLVREHGLTSTTSAPSRRSRRRPHAPPILSANV